MSGSFHLDWQERWVSPGVCLLGRSCVDNRGVLGSIANRMMTPSGLWAFVHERSVALLDAPFAWQDAEDVLARIRTFLDAGNYRVDCIAASHLHLDHSAGLARMLDEWPSAAFVTPLRWRHLWSTFRVDRIKYGWQPDLSSVWVSDRWWPYESHLATTLCGEPLHFVEAPYHSPSDQIATFRGLAILPDWHLPETHATRLKGLGVSRNAIRNTLHRLLRFEKETGYRIHSRTAVHGDEPVRHDFVDRIQTACDVFNVNSSLTMHEISDRKF